MGKSSNGKVSGGKTGAVQSPYLLSVSTSIYKSKAVTVQCKLAVRSRECHNESLSFYSRGLFIRAPQRRCSQLHLLAPPTPSPP